MQPCCSLMHYCSKSNCACVASVTSGGHGGVFRGVLMLRIVLLSIWWLGGPTPPFPLQPLVAGYLFLRFSASALTAQSCSYQATSMTVQRRIAISRPGSRTSCPSVADSGRGVCIEVPPGIALEAGHIGLVV